MNKYDSLYMGKKMMNMRNNMDDLREKVISALQGEVDSAAYMGHSFKDCVPVRHLVDALSLLKAQEPRVMTLEEVAKWIDIPDESKDPIFVEYGRKMKFGHSGWRTQFFGFSPKFHAKIYGVELRCWTARPTDEQREAVKWNESTNCLRRITGSMQSVPGAWA